MIYVMFQVCFKMYDSYI